MNNQIPDYIKKACQDLENNGFLHPEQEDFEPIVSIILKHLAAPLSTHQEAVSLAKALVDRLKLIHEDPCYKGVWQIAAIHGFAYKGPNYEKEMAALDAYLKTHAQGQLKDEQPGLDDRLEAESYHGPALSQGNTAGGNSGKTDRPTTHEAGSTPASSTHQQSVQCDACKGKGEQAYYPGGIQKCHKCDGWGFTPKPIIEYPKEVNANGTTGLPATVESRMSDPAAGVCPECFGQGTIADPPNTMLNDTIPTYKCPTCHGTGKRGKA